MRVTALTQRTSMRMVGRVPAILACLLGGSAAALAQAAVAGVVKDVTGAPLPGAVVDARSPGLIERVRSAIADGSGRYRIEDLRPGLYTVTFSLEGLSSIERSGIELTGSLTTTVDAELAAAPLSATVTITGQLPLVDIHSSSHEVAIPGDVLGALPTVRSYNAIVALVPGVVTNTNDTVTGTGTAQFPIHGGRTAEGRLLLDGLNIGSPANGNSAASYVVDVGQSAEVTFSTAGASGEAETGGLIVNIVPKTGGNTTQASVFASGTGEKLHSENLTPGLREQGVAAATPLSKVYDVSGTLGGPIREDRLWYFVNAHRGGSRRDVNGVFYNRNAGDPSKWLYTPDTSRPEYSDRVFENGSGRVTWQATPRNKIGAFWDEQALCRTCTGATPGLQEPPRVSPEAVGILSRPLRVTQATWSSPVTNRLLLEAGWSSTSFGVGNFERRPNPTRDLIRVVEQCASGCPANGNIPGLVYRSQDFSASGTGSYLWKASVSYVTGGHSLKFGAQHTLMTDDRMWFTNNQNLTYRFDNGVPNQLTESISPWTNNARAAWDALYAQERWTRDRLTLQGAVRFDRARSWFPAQQEGPSRFLPAPVIFSETSGVDSYKDITPRIGAVYDLFGTRKTALKMHVGKYLEGAGVAGTYANTNPTLRMPQTTSAFGTPGVTRTWTDANGNLVADCDLLNPAAQDLRAVGADFCGVVSNTSFGTPVLTNNFDSRLLNGWGVRPSDWNLGVSIQQQILARASVEVAYVRRWYRGFSVVDNLQLEPSDLTPFSVPAPRDSRLPNGGGYLVSGLYDVVPEKAGQVSNFVADSGRYGAWSQYFDGLDITVNARARTGLVLVGGTSTGQTVSDSCDLRAHLPEFATSTTGSSPFGAGLTGSTVSPVSPYCHVAFGIITQFRGFASYLVPRANVQLSATLQSKPGAMLAANYVAPNSAVAPSLGRSLSGAAPNVTVNLVAPGTMYGDRVNQLDFRVAKTVKVGRSRIFLAIDVYNSLNSSAVLTYNTAFVPGGPWLQPLTILTPRFLRMSTEFDF